MDIKSLLILKCFCLLILYFNPIVEGDLQYGFCANPECSEPVGIGITLIQYVSPDDNRISVGSNEEVEIFVKEYGPKKDLLGVTVRGNKGYISKQFVRETKTYVKDLVPAKVEFKTTILVTSDFIATSHLHVISNHHQSESLSSNTVPETIVQTQTLQSVYMNSMPNNLQQALNSPNEYLQSSHSSPNFDPINNAQFGLHSQFGQSEQWNNVPQHSSHFEAGNSLVFPHAADMKSENILSSETYNHEIGDSSVNPSDSMSLLTSSESKLNNILNTHFENVDSLQNDMFEPSSVYSEQTQQIYNKNPSSIRSSQEFPSDPDSNEYASRVLQSQPSSSLSVNDYPSSVQMPQQQYPSSESVYNYPSSVQESQHVFSQSINNYPSGVQLPQDHLSLQSGNKLPPSVLQQFQTGQHLSSSDPGMQSSVYSDENFDPLTEDDIAKTYAMLSDRGFHSDYVYSNSFAESQGQQSSQHTTADFIASEVNLNTESNSPQHSSVPSNDASLHSSVNSNSDFNFENKIVNSDVPKENFNEPSQNTKTENINYKISVDEDLLENKIPIGENLQEDKISIRSVDEDLLENKIPIGGDLQEDEGLESELLAESDDDVGEEEEDESEEDDLTKTDASKEDSAVFHSRHAENSNTEYNLKSSMSSGLMNDENSKVHQDRTTSEEKVSSSIQPMLPESKVSENVVTHTSVPTSIDKQNESTDGFNKTKNIENTPYVLSDAASSDINKKSADFEAVQEKYFKAVNDLQESAVYDQEQTTPSVNNYFNENEQELELNKILNTVDIEGIGDSIRSTYQIRNLKGEYVTNEEQQSDPEIVNEENNTDINSDGSSSFENGLLALKSFVDYIISWIPEPFYSLLMDLQNKGISPRVPIFTALCGFVCIFLIVPLVYIKESSKESSLITQLALVEKNVYTLSATNIILEEKLEIVQTELSSLQALLDKEKTISENLKLEFENQKDELENTKGELESCSEELESLREKENEYLSLLNDKEKEKENLLEHKSSLDKIITDQENSIASLTDQLQESENNVKELEKEKTQLLQMKEDYEEKIALFDRNCNQLLQEAEVWNLRVNELTLKVNEETELKEELKTSLKERNEEIESLKQLVETFKSFDEIEDPEGETKTKEEKLQFLINSSMILNQLKKEEDRNKVLEEQLSKEKNKILDMEVELLDAKSEIDKLKLSYNQALQDKAEAQTKLDVLTNYFKDKEIQLQKQLGAQEAVRQKKEEDANSAERRICLIEQENASYKYQVASMKQEMEETERNLKSQIAAQEKKAHENWIAARAAERKLEDMKQEVTQLRQRLTLLEREQENWANSTRDDIIRPVPKRIQGVSEESSSQDLNTSERGMFPPPPLHDRLPPVPPMMLPPDRPLPPLPPPPMPPMFLPPMERHFRPQPWHLPPDHSSDYRTTPPEFIGGRESTPPRGRQSTITDGDAGPNTSSPLTTDTRDSRNSTPPHLLPDFHDLPPQPGRPFFPPPPLGHHRLPFHPPYRRDPAPKRLDNPNEYNSRGSQQQPPQEQWQHSRV